MEDTLIFATSLARQVGALLMEYYQAPGLKASLKRDHSLVTEADLAADLLISESIHKQFPDELILSEEGQVTSLQHASKPMVDSSWSERYMPVTWIVDPLDGTTNFSLGMHFWGVLLTRLVSGWPEMTVLYFPLIGELYTAKLDGGAFLNDQPIHVQPPIPERPLSFFACCSRTYRLYSVRVPYKTRILGSASYTFCCVARGAAVLGFEATPKIWDIAGPWLLINEAGGVIQTLDGNLPFPLSKGVSYASLDFPTLAAATSELISKARQQIQPK